MQQNKTNEEYSDRYKRMLRFGIIALAVMFLNGLLDIKRGLIISSAIILAMVIAISCILVAIYKGHTKGTITAIVFIINPLLIVNTFAEGLKAGCYLFILPLLFALAFLMSNVKLYLIEIAAYFFITVASFCICILFCADDSTWQYLSPQLSANMFTYNSICVTVLCAIFAYTGIYFEKQNRAALLNAKNTAEMHEQKIKSQNKHLQEIAFMNAHILRSPLTNILALTALINSPETSDDSKHELIEHLKTSAQQLDDAIKEIVAKTKYEGNKI
jgi:signal transduction histidine kinase